MANLLLTMLDKVGVKADHFSDSAGELALDSLLDLRVSCGGPCAMTGRPSALNHAVDINRL